MDIQVSSNFERYLYFLLDEDAAQVKALMQQMATSGRLEVSAERLAEVRSLFTAAAVSEAETLVQIRATYEGCGYILDPHTAVGVHAARDLPGAVCLATAHPAKFGDAVRQAIGVEAPPPPSLQGLEGKEARCAVLEASAGAVKAFMQETLARHEQSVATSRSWTPPCGTASRPRGSPSPRRRSSTSPRRC
jgi:threonine synthase